MKRLLAITSAALLVLSAAPATVFAKPQHHHNGSGGNGGKPGDKPGNGGGNGGSNGGSGGSGGGGKPGKPGGGHHHKPGKPGSGHHHKPGKPGWHGHGRWTRPHHFTWRGRRFNAIRLSIRFNWPAGYRYRLYARGERLPPIFLAPTYYYTDYATVGLTPPPPGQQWVRYGDDLLLVDTVTGQVIDVIPGAFYE